MEVKQSIEVVLEIGINANGDINLAKKLIDVAYSAGIKYVKLQKRTIDLVYTPDELATPRKSAWGATTKEQKEGLEFGKSQYEEIENYCNGKVRWFASPWDLQSLQFLKDFNPPFIKIPSARITDMHLLDACSELGIPVVLSTGMSDYEMIDKAIGVLGKDIVYCIMHCTSTYPTKVDESNVRCITAMKERYPWAKIGFSNHYPGLMSMVIASTLGAEMLEFHATLDRTMEGSDQAASIEPQGVFKLMEYLKLIEKMMGDGVKRIYDSEIPIIKKLRR